LGLSNKPFFNKISLSFLIKKNIMEILIKEKPQLFDIKSLLIQKGYKCSSPLFHSNQLVVRSGTVAVNIKIKDDHYEIRSGANTSNILVALPVALGATFAGFIGAMVGVVLGVVLVNAFADKEAFQSEVIEALQEKYELSEA
jgi:hypothetical protein